MKKTPRRIRRRRPPATVLRFRKIVVFHYGHYYLHIHTSRFAFVQDTPMHQPPNTIKYVSSKIDEEYNR